MQDYFGVELEQLPRHSKALHSCDVTLLTVKVTERVYRNSQGGDWKKMLAQLEY